ncbi:hypothetical protein T10_10210 [Trichinella papuae]|uniref:Uncharacterized protein n=1 Tax=Trichinella papuae TaxID=268474 RepID=A0A0V1MTQ4_9BILA|nr:hypothetical protein T10_10210 [Trichinella papuae]
MDCPGEANIAQGCAVSTNTSLKCRECIAHKNACIPVPFQESFRLLALPCIKIGTMRALEASYSTRTGLYSMKLCNTL